MLKSCQNNSDFVMLKSCQNTSYFVMLKSCQNSLDFVMLKSCQNMLIFRKSQSRTKTKTKTTKTTTTTTKSFLRPLRYSRSKTSNTKGRMKAWHANGMMVFLFSPSSQSSDQSVLLIRGLFSSLKFLHGKMSCFLLVFLQSKVV